MHDNQTDSLNSPLKYKTVLTLRYMIALGLIASVISFTYFFLMSQIESNREDAYIINVSGKQRMLSQRIALFSREIYHAESQENADLFAGKMGTAVQTMRDNHLLLTQNGYSGQTNNKLSPEIIELYYGQKGINQRIEIFLSHAYDFVNLYESGGQVAIQQSSLMNDIVSIARNGLLDMLDRAVGQYQSEFESKVDNFSKYETLFFIVGLSILLAEILFIFRPMVKEITSNKDALEASNKELLEFSYRISHDLRAPIVSSIGLSRSALKALEKGEVEKTEKSLSFIQSSMVRLEELIDDVMTLTQMKMAPQNKTTFLVGDIIEDSLCRLKDMPNFDKIKLIKKISLSVPITLEKLYLQQSIENLISNSIKYYDPDQDQPFIQITAKNESGYYVFSVRDNGIGIPEETRDRLFGMFQRFHPKISFGSGLGLYLVQKNIERIGGEINHSPQFEGSEFTIRIPVKA